MKLKFYILLAVSLIIGFAIGWIDSGPTWDDTGITVTAIFAAALFSGILIRRFAWVWALAIGIWTPVLDILRQSNYESIVAVPFAFAGAYVGAVIRKVARIIKNW